MPKDYFNDPAAQTTGRIFPASPQALMFERLVSEMQSTLDEDVFFDDSDWPHGFDWANEAEAVWDGLAEDATLLAKFHTRSPADQMLCRAAGLIYRAIRAGSPHELDAVRVKLAEIMNLPAPANVHFLLEQAELSFEQMADRAKAGELEPPETDLGPTPRA